MELSKKFSNRNLDGMFRLILLIYVEKIRTNMCQSLCKIN